ncbi:hypothetical protein EYF80_019529 [Liparis tanakae]|uniref:Uncharacterized protein n=1 Tax=Liparis tanakae TaxID=230148 RepID=A0A4Z2HYC5_9TELE|nr:hypothetical protein EYF80_019529 [Liparis tanakae]
MVEVVVVMMVVDVTEGQQAIVRVTPADGVQPFTRQSKEDRKKERKTKRLLWETDLKFLHSKQTVAMLQANRPACSIAS